MSTQINTTAILLEGEKTCTLPKIMSEALPIAGDWTFHKIYSCVAAVLAILTLLISLASTIRHLTNYTSPGEQRQIIRIIWTPLIFAVFNFFSLWFYTTAAYLEPIAQIYEVFALVAIFLLFLSFVCPHTAQRDDFFANLEPRWPNGKVKHERGSLRFYFCIWILVFQLLPSRIVLSIAYWIVHTTLCPLDPELLKASIVIEVVESLFTTLTLVSIIVLYRRLKTELRGHGALSKLVMFKLIVFIQIIQGPIFSGLLGGKVLKASEHISYEDWSVGIPAFCTCCEMFIFSIIFLFPFTAKPYIYRVPDHENIGYRRNASMSFGSALLDALSPWDVISGACSMGPKLLKVFNKNALASPYMCAEQDQMQLRTSHGQQTTYKQLSLDAQEDNEHDLSAQSSRNEGDVRVW